MMTTQHAAKRIGLGGFVAFMSAATMLLLTLVVAQIINVYATREIKAGIGQSLAVMFLDLNKFKLINDTHGHAAGDQVLIAFAQRVTQAVRKTDTVARLAGDEFVVLAENLAGGEDDAVHVAQKILAALATPLVDDAVTVVGATSIGIALYRDGDENAEQLLARADHAMYAAKSGGGNRWQLAA